MIADELLAIYGGRGAVAYFGEAVTVTEHSLQTVHFAQRCDAPDGLVIAALLHDIGHLIDAVAGDVADWKTDAGHERTGSRWLASFLPSDIFEPVRLHVPAKRYKFATDPAYLGALSPASVMTLRLQGGPMSRAEVDTFETEPYFRSAILLRQWDDQAKIRGFATPDFAHYAPRIENLAADYAERRQAVESADTAAATRDRRMK
jgi:predicted HD phosphohydrolase